MSIIVEHEKRRREILEKALDVFVDEGFEDVTFQKIADRSGITRTTLYIYFKNKKEIFNYSIKQFLQELENEITGIKNSEGLSHKDQLITIMSVIIDRLEQNQRLLNVVLNSLLYITKGDNTPDYRVRRRTMRLRHILNSLIIEGIHAKEFASVNIKEANEALYGFIEAAIFRLVILHHNEVDELKKAVIMVINQMAAD
jgi:AcrR family transcriptional regulator